MQDGNSDFLATYFFNYTKISLKKDGKKLDFMSLQN